MTDVSAEALLMTLQAVPHEILEPPATPQSLLSRYTAKVLIEQVKDGCSFSQTSVVDLVECVDIIQQSRQIADLVAEALCKVQEGDGRIRGVFVWTSDLTAVER